MSAVLMPVTVAASTSRCNFTFVRFSFALYVVPRVTVAISASVQYDLDHAALGGEKGRDPAHQRRARIGAHFRGERVVRVVFESRIIESEVLLQMRGLQI